MPRYTPPVPPNLRGFSVNLTSDSTSAALCSTALESGELSHGGALVETFQFHFHQMILRQSESETRISSWMLCKVCRSIPALIENLRGRHVIVNDHRTISIAVLSVLAHLLFQESIIRMTLCYFIFGSNDGPLMVR